MIESPLLHVGFGNLVMADEVLAILEYKIPAVKRLIKSALAEKPRSVINLTVGRKAVSIVVLSGDRYVISAIYTKQLAKRLGAAKVDE